MSSCLSGSDLKSFRKAIEAYELNGAPILDRDLSPMVKLELEAALIAQAVEDGGPSAYPGEPTRTQLRNPPFGVADILETVQETKAARADLEQSLLERGSSPGEARRASDEALPFPIFTQKNLDIDPKYVLSFSYKLSKSSGYGWHTPGLYLAASTMSRVADTCASASDGCRAACLVASGRGDFEGKGSGGLVDDLIAGKQVNVVADIRVRRTLLYVFNRPDFRRMVIQALGREQANARKFGLKFGFRLNTTSDLGWESEGIYEQFPKAGGYDYTKQVARFSNFLESEAFNFFGGGACAESNCVLERNPHSKWPKNYFLSFSFSEINMAWCLVFLRRGGNIVVPFDNSLGKDTLPTHFLGRKVIDGDYFDPRLLDYSAPRDRSIVGDLDAYSTDEPPPYVVGLSVKGVKQRREQRSIADSDEGGFFFSAKAAQDHGDDPDFIAEALAKNVRECFRQKLAHGKNPLMFLPTKAVFKKYVPDLAERYSAILDENVARWA